MVPHKYTIFSTICLQPEGTRGWKVTGLLFVKSKACQTAASISSLRVAGGGRVCWGFDRSTIWPLWTAAVWEDSWILWTTHSLMVQMLKRYTVQDVSREEPSDPLLWSVLATVKWLWSATSFNLIRSSQGQLGRHLLSPFLCGQHLLPRGFPPTAVVPTGPLERLPWTETRREQGLINKL